MSAERVDGSSAGSGKWAELEKLGQPDFVGRWEENQPGEFRLFFLRRHAEPLVVPCAVVPGSGVVDIVSVPPGTKVIEGIIQDDVGLAIFSGVMSTSEIQFVKTYSGRARYMGAMEDIVYKGRYDKKNKSFKGNYFVHDQKRGEFSMRRYEAKPL